MLISDFISLLTMGEGANLEFKRDDIRPVQLAKEIVAFANMIGGRILLGVEDSGQISGVERENAQAWLMDTVIRRYVHPQIIPDYEEIEYEGKKVAVISVPMGTAKPYAVCDNDRQDFYLRMGDTCQLADREQTARLFQSGGLISAEKFPVHSSSIEDFDMRRMADYFLRILEEKEVQDWDEKLINREFLVADNWNNDAYYCSYLGYLLFAKKPRLRLPQAGIRLLVYPGIDESYDAKLDEVLDIPFVGLYGLEAETIEKSLPERVLEYLQPHISNEKVKDMQRGRHWDYHPDVIRELLINAFAHRDWTKQNDVHLTVFQNRMEVNSPGALPNGMTIDKIKEGQQTPRNTNIVRILRDYQFMDDRGMGIRRKVIPLMNERNNTTPDFKATDDYFKVTLYKE